MRNSRAKQIRQEQKSKPEGTTHSDIRRARREYSNGLKRVPVYPKQSAPIGHPGFPGNTVQVIDTWLEKQPHVKEIERKVIKGKGKNPGKVVYTVINREKNVTRVISRPKAKTK